MKPVIYMSTGHPRAKHVALALLEGFRRHGIFPVVRQHWTGAVEGDVALAYGWAHEPVFAAYKAAGASYAYWDLGYWNRSPNKGKGGSREGAYRLALNSWDTADHMARDCPSDRFAAAGLVLRDPPDLQNGGGLVLVAGMSGKAAGTHGFQPDQWETAMLAHLQGLTWQEVQFRAKKKRLAGMEPIDQVLRRTWLAVMHHSNVAVDALLAGVPVYAVKGVGKLWSGPLTCGGTLARRLYLPGERERYAADVAYAQWTTGEMRSGAAWNHVRDVLARLPAPAVERVA